MNLQEIIIEKIRKEGPIRFHDFMEMCLYDPGFGYYTSPRSKIGKTGDFYTSTSLTPVFGAMIAKKLEEMWIALGCSKFSIIEYGAGTGRLCHDILNYLQQNEKFYQQLSYYILEKSPVMQEIEQKLVHEKVSWVDSLSEVPEITGCILSNELLDNFAVHQVVMEEELQEVYITYDDGFKEMLQPAASELKEYLYDLEINLPKGFRTEINLQARDWLKEASAKLNRGYILTIDYGGLSPELYKPGRSEGTLLSYNNHTVSDRIYDQVGEQDITAHVNFSALMFWAARNGLKNCSYTDQCTFLLEQGFRKALEESFSTEKNVLQAARQVAIINHTLLYEMGTKYKVLIQEKRGPT